MSQAEELLNSVSEEVPVHTHPVPDTDTYFVIDPVTRKIENTNPKKHVIMQYDHNSERCTFELPRFIDGHDMLECTSVTVNVDNIEVVESDGVEEAEPVEPRINSDAPDMTDLRIHPNDPEKVISSWLISRNSTQLAGILSFHIEYKCVDSNGDVVYEWSTDNYDEYEIRARKKNGEAAIVPHIDTLEQWRTRIFGAGDSVMANIAAEGEAQVAAVKAESKTQQEAVELKGAQTQESIPEDYTETNNMADEAVRSKADAIVCEEAGESVILKDSSNDNIRGLKLFGKSSQDGTPSPDNPIEIVNIGDTGRVNIDVCGVNKYVLYKRNASLTANGVTFTIGEDGTILINGTASTNTWIEVIRGFKSGTNPRDDKIISLNPNSMYVLSRTDLGGSVTGAVTVTVQASANHDGTGLYSANRYVAVKGDGVYRGWITLSPGTVCSNYKIAIQLEEGNVPTDYITATRQSVVLRTSNGLSGIPVTSGGNYTDSDGQQWICDEIDLERGVYVQRVGIKDFDGSDDEDWGGVSEVTDNMRSWIAVQGAYRPESDTANGIMCSQFNPQVSMNKGAFYQNRDRFFFGSGMTLNAWKTHLQSKPLQLVYILSTPIETPLTAEEIAAFKALRTNYPNTTILNDAGAWMSVKYNADTKTYIDEPKVLKLVDSSTGVVYELKVVDGNLTVVPVQ